MNFLDDTCLSQTKTIEQFSEFPTFTLFSKNNNELGQYQTTDKFNQYKNSVKGNIKHEFRDMENYGGPNTNE